MLTLLFQLILNVPPLSILTPQGTVCRAMHLTKLVGDPNRKASLRDGSSVALTTQDIELDRELSLQFADALRARSKNIKGGMDEDGESDNLQPKVHRSHFSNRHRGGIFTRKGDWPDGGRCTQPCAAYNPGGLGSDDTVAFFPHHRTPLTRMTGPCVFIKLPRHGWVGRAPTSPRCCCSF